MLLKFYFASFVSTSIILCIRLYQRTLSPLLPLLFGTTGCRHQPTCSEYFILSVRQSGPFTGSLRGFRRLLGCHPWSHA